MPSLRLKIACACICSFFLSTYAIAQQISWGVQSYNNELPPNSFSAHDYNTKLSTPVIDSSGNMYVVATSNNQLLWKDTSDISIHQSDGKNLKIHAQNSLLKYSPEGKLLWHVEMNGYRIVNPNRNAAKGVCLFPRPDGEVWMLVCLFPYTNGDFNAGQTSIIPPSLRNGIKYDYLCILKFDQNGHLTGYKNIAQLTTSGNVSPLHGFYVYPDGHSVISIGGIDAASKFSSAIPNGNGGSAWDAGQAHTEIVFLNKDLRLQNVIEIPDKYPTTDLKRAPDGLYFGVRPNDNFGYGKSTIYKVDDNGKLLKLAELTGAENAISALTVDEKNNLTIAVIAVDTITKAGYIGIDGQQCPVLRNNICQLLVRMNAALQVRQTRILKYMNIFDLSPGIGGDIDAVVLSYRNHQWLDGYSLSIEPKESPIIYHFLTFDTTLHAKWMSYFRSNDVGNYFPPALNNNRGIDSNYAYRYTFSNQWEVNSFTQNRCGRIVLSGVRHSVVNGHKIDSLLPEYSWNTLIIVSPPPARFRVSTRHFCGYDSVHVFADTFYSGFVAYKNDTLISQKRDFIVPVHSGEKYGLSITGLRKKGCDEVYTDSLTGIKHPHAAFITADTVGCQWLGFHFYNRSDEPDSGIVRTYYWDFGDGKSDTAAYPVHIYTREGNYTVRLLASNDACTDTFTQVRKVTILAAPRPGFFTSASEGCVPLSITVTDNSEGRVLQRIFRAGNGDSTTDSVAVFNYTHPGKYWLHQELLGPTGCVTRDSQLIIVHEGLDPQVRVQASCMDVAGDGQIVLRWISLPNVKIYKVYRQEDRSPDVLISTTTDTFYVDNTVKDPTLPLVYTLYAEDSCGGQSRRASYSIPQLQGENHNNQYALLTWRALPDMPVTSYCLEAERPGGSFRTIACRMDTFWQDFQFVSDSNVLRQCYRLTVQLSNGCIAHSAIRCVDYDPRLFIPNAFSPNDNSRNDTFFIRGIAIHDFHMDIYNRWGERVFTTNDIHRYWTGENCPMDVYYYIVSARGGNRPIYRKGTITLLR